MRNQSGEKPADRTPADKGQYLGGRETSGGNSTENGEDRL